RERRRGSHRSIWTTVQFDASTSLNVAPVEVWTSSQSCGVDDLLAHVKPPDTMRQHHGRGTSDAFFRIHWRRTNKASWALDSGVRGRASRWKASITFREPSPSRGLMMIVWHPPT